MSKVAVPIDLVPLCRWAARLSMPSARLRRMSAQGEFVPVFEIEARVYRVSDSAAEEWLRDREVSTVRSKGISEVVS